MPQRNVGKVKKGCTGQPQYSVPSILGWNTWGGFHSIAISMLTVCDSDLRLAE